MRNYKDFQKNNFVYRENGVEIFLKKKGSSNKAHPFFGHNFCD